MNTNKTTALLNRQWGSAIIEALFRSSIDYFVISPGSRSTPLTVAVARKKGVKTIVCFDERAAAFHALGYARATGKPAVLICTSGTAAANYYPAIIEAATDCQPLIVITADRPPELRETGANQTIRQTGMFADYPRWTFDFPAPDSAVSIETVFSTMSHAVFCATNSPAGPVHLNCMFREPFVDAALASEAVDFSEIKSTTYAQARQLPDEKTIKKCAEQIARAKQKLIIAGRGLGVTDINEIVKLANQHNLPVFADVQSRFSSPDLVKISVPYFDQLLLSTTFKNQFRPDVVIQFGAMPVSKRLSQWMNDVRPQHYFTIAKPPFRIDPNHQVSDRIVCEPAEFCRSLNTGIDSSIRTNTHTIDFDTIAKKIDQLIGKHVDFQSAAVTEISAARQIISQIKPHSGLFLASSMPIRDVDMFCNPVATPLRVAANRGASGIDGTIATATGFATGLHSPVTLLIGDLALLHDMNSLALLNLIEQPLIIVLINNKGGGIFSFLPVSGHSDIFEEYFGTPHHFEFSNLARQFGLAYAQPINNSDFAEKYLDWQNNGTRGIIEIHTSRAENHALHIALQNEIKQLVDDTLAGRKS